MPADSIEGAIDCHVHAYPDWRRPVRQALEHLPGPLARGVGGAGGAVLDLAERLRRRRAQAGASQVTATEQVARLRDRLPQAPARGLEYAVSTATGAATLAAGSVRRLLESMDRFGLAKAVVIASHDVADNDWLLGEAVAAAPDRLIPVAILPELPSGGTQDAWAEAFDGLAEAGARGFKIHPNLDDRPASDPAYRALFEVAAARDRFVIVHTGEFAVPVYRDRSPAAPDRFEALFEAFPGVRVCLAHMNREQPEGAWAVMRRHEQVYTDTSWQPPGAVRRAVDAVGVDRILLGSDWPLLHRDLQHDALSVLHRAVSPSEAAQIARGNAEAFLGG